MNFFLDKTSKSINFHRLPPDFDPTESTNSSSSDVNFRAQRVLIGRIVVLFNLIFNINRILAMKSNDGAPLIPSKES